MYFSRSFLFLFLLILLLAVVCSEAVRNRRKQKFVRLPSGFTFPADGASNFQRDTYVPATFSPPSEKILQSPPRYITGVGNEGAKVSTHVSGMNYAEYKNAILGNPQSLISEIVGPAPEADSYKATPPPESLFAGVEGGGVTVPPVTIVSSPGMMPLDVVTEPTPVATTTAATSGLRKDILGGVADTINHRHGLSSPEQQASQKGHTYTALGGGQFYQSLLGGKGSFSPLSLFLNGLGGGGGGGSNPGFLVPVPVVIPPPPPPPPGPKCFTNPSGFLCCNVTLEKAMEEAYIEAKAEGISSCNVQKMASAIQEKTEKKFGTTFESIAAHKDFVAKINFAGDLNCKIEIDGKYILAYATPLAEQDINIVDANSFFSGGGADLDDVNGTKPTYIVYGPIK